MFDSDLMLRTASDGALNADEQTTGIDIGKGGTPKKGMTVKVVVPQATGTNPTLDITIEASDSQGSGYVPVGKHPQITAAGTYYIRFATDHRYVRMNNDTGGTSPNFGTVIAGIIPV